MSLIEVMIAAGLMGALSYMGMMLFEQQNKQARDIQVRFEVQDVLGQIRSLLGDSLSCQASLAEVKVDNNGSDTAPSFLSEVVDIQDNKFVTKDRFHTMASQPDRKYGNNLVQIQKYELSNNNDPEVGINESTRTGSLYLNVYFDKGKLALGGAIIRKSILLKIVLDSEVNKIVSCTSSNVVSGSNGGIGQTLVIADPNVNSLLYNLTGDEACSKLGHKCVAVISNNYLSRSTGDSGIGFVCSSSYNLKLQGVEMGAGKSQWHSCYAKLGNYNTFSTNSPDGKSSAECKGVFTAICL